MTYKITNVVLSTDGDIRPASTSTPLPLTYNRLFPLGDTVVSSDVHFEPDTEFTPLKASFDPTYGAGEIVYPQVITGTVTIDNLFPNASVYFEPQSQATFGYGNVYQIHVGYVKNPGDPNPADSTYRIVYNLTFGFLVFDPGHDASPAPMQARTNLSAPGSRFCRAECAFTSDSPPKPVGIKIWRGNGPVPKLSSGTLWEKTGVVVSGNAADTSPSLALDHRRLLYLAFSRDSSGVYVKRSDDYGDTWRTGIDRGSAETMAIPNGIMPALASKGGKLLLAALSGTDAAGYQVMVCCKGIGDAKFSAAKAATQKGGAAMTAQKSGLALCHADEAADRWVLSVLIKGETATSEWWSADDGASFTRIPAS